MERLFFAFGCVFAFLGVALGAFATHGLKTRLSPEMLDVFEVAVRYQMYHALALCGVAWALTRWPRPEILVGGWLFVAGVVIFSGTLYVLSLTGIRWLGAITPLGGVAFLAGWLTLLWGVLRATSTLQS